MVVDILAARLIATSYSLCPEGRFVRYAAINCYKLLRRLPKRTTRFYTHVHFVDLLSSYPPGRNLHTLSDEGITLFGVGEILAIDNLQFLILLDKRVDGEGFVFERAPEGGRIRACGLCRS
jgi:hypothetical protein